MIELTKDGVYVKLASEAVDSLAVAVLKEGRALVLASREDTLSRIAMEGRYNPYQIADLADYSRHLDAFDLLLEYYGEELHG